MFLTLPFTVTGTMGNGSKIAFHSPRDGRRIAFTSIGLEGAPEIHIMNADGQYALEGRTPTAFVTINL